MTTIRSSAHGNEPFNLITPSHFQPTLMTSKPCALYGNYISSLNTTDMQAVQTTIDPNAAMFPDCLTQLNKCTISKMTRVGNGTKNKLVWPNECTLASLERAKLHDESKKELAISTSNSPRFKLHSCKYAQK
eukprot:scaffold1727_cov198-Alexandrium_tamarense.AAC.15